MTASIACHIYRCRSKTGMYVYLAEKDNFDALPDALRNQLGILEFSFGTDLDENKALRELDTKQVIAHLKKDGYFLQMPPANSNFLDLDLRRSDGF